MVTYRGSINISDVECSFVFSESDFILRIFSENSNGLDWEAVRSIIKNGMVSLLDSHDMELYLFIGNYDPTYYGEFAFRIVGFMCKGKYKSNDFKAKSLLFRHDIIKYSFERTESTLDRYISLVNAHKAENNLTNRVPIGDDFRITIRDKEHLIEFGTMSDFDCEKEDLSFFDYMLVKNDSGIDIEDIYIIVDTVKAFLQLIAQTRNINIDSVRVEFLIPPDSGFTNNNTEFYLALEQEDYISKYKVLKFDHIKEGISNLFEQISLNMICLRSLFCHSQSNYYVNDIINICAAFEMQFEITNPKVKFKEQRAVKKNMITCLEKTRENYSGIELEHFEIILEGLKNFRDTLKKRIEIALVEFVRIYEQIKGADGIDYKNLTDYCQSFPDRIVKARNALSHGNLIHPITESDFEDAELLRAITYMLIFKKAKIDDYNIMRCLERMLR